MKDYSPGIIRCRCTNSIRQGKQVRIYQYTLERKKCPNCGKMRKLFVLKKRPSKVKAYIKQGK